MENIAGYIATGLVSLFVGLVIQRFKDKPRLLYWLPGSFVFKLQDPKVTLRTDSLTIQNVGRQASSNIEIIHKARPDHFQFSQPVDFSEHTTPSGEHIIKIASLGPKEHVNIQLMSHRSVPILGNVRSAEGQAQLIQVRLQRVFPKLLTAFAGGFMLLGFGFFLYWSVLAILFLSKAMGIGVVS